MRPGAGRQAAAAQEGDAARRRRRRCRRPGRPAARAQRSGLIDTARRNSLSCGVSSAENGAAPLGAGEEDAGVGAALEDLLDGVARGLGRRQRRLDRLHELLHEHVDVALLRHGPLRYHTAPMASWTPLGSTVRYTRGKLALREDTWRLPDGTERVYPVLVVGVTVGVLPFVDAGPGAARRASTAICSARVVGAAGRRRPAGRRPGGGRPARAARGGRLPGRAPRASSRASIRRTPTSTRPRYCYVAQRSDARSPARRRRRVLRARASCPLDEAVRMALDGEITESFSKVAILQYALAARR